MTDPAASNERFLVTGALGCIGAWTVRTLVREGVPVVAFDLGRDPRRIAQVVEPDELDQVTFVTGDITDLAALERALDEHGPSPTSSTLPRCRSRSAGPTPRSARRST